MTPPPWPWPQDSREDRAKRVALSYRHLAEAAANGAIAVTNMAAALRKLDDQWTVLGAGWVQPIPEPLNLDDWVTAPDMAGLFHVPARTIRDWGVRGNIRVRRDHGATMYNVGDVVDHGRRRRIKRSA